ncbi:MAG: SGNH/GDSL hydrolase family protein [Actinomycetota bacterium]|nr:SGNH/GDSL hydrolase family protein [Actinomycetota bacterium]
MASTGPRVPAANLGDSFSSGEGGTETGPYLPGTDTPANQCHRSRTSAARLLDATSFVDVVVDAACSGATTQNIVSAERFGEPPQVNRLNAAVKQTYLMIGGNDIGFGTLVGCVLQSNCDQTPIPDGARLLLTQLPSKLDQAYAAVQAATPNATHTVVLYPPLLPPTPPAGHTTDLSRCPELNPKELVISNELFSQLNNVITQQARARHFQVINLEPAFRGHDVCSAAPFFYRPNTASPSATYHPALPGRVAIAGSLALHRIVP